MGAGRYVGRVGALAVALGVGAAVTVGAGVAWADESGGSTSSAASKHAPHQKTHRHKAADSSPADSSPAASSDGAADSSAPKTSKAKHSLRKSKAKDGSSADAGKRRSAVAAVAGKTAPSVAAAKPAAADVAAPPSHAVGVAPAAAPTVASVTAVPAAASVAAPVSVVSSSAGTTSAASALAVLFGGGTGAPALAPVSWVLAAASRRELGTTKTESVATGAVVAAGPVSLAAVPVAGTANQKPVFTAPVVNAADGAGVVTGSVSAVDADGDSLTYTAGKAGKGAVAVDPVTGGFTYTPTVAAMHAASSLTAKASALSDSFTVKVSDGKGGTATQTVTVPVTPVNTVPTVSADLVVSKTSSTGVVTGSIKVTDADKDSLTYSGSSDKGKVTVTSKGVFTFTPSAAARHAASADGATDADTTATVSVTVSDGHGGSQTQSVVVDITPKNSNPSLSVSVGSANASSGVVTGTIKVSDADKDSVSVSVDATSAKGGLVAYDSLTGKYSYIASEAARHAAAASGASKADKADTFTVTVDDGHGGVLTKTVTVSVAGANTAPVKTVATVGAPDASGVVTGTLNATDADGDSLTYSVSKPKKGSVTVNTDGSFTYTASAAAMHAAAASNAKVSALSDTFTVKVSDGHGGTTTQTVTVAIALANADPTVTAGPVVTKTNASTGVVTGSIKVVDDDKDSLKYTASAVDGKVTISSKGVFTYTPSAAARHAAAAGGPSTDTVSITVTDGHGGSVTQTVSVEITAKNANPSVSVSIGKANATTGVITGTVKVTDADKDSVTISVDAASAKGGLVTYDSATGTYTYTPTVAARNAAAIKNAPKADKSDTFTVSVDDGHGGVVNKVVTVSVSPKAGAVNTAPTNGHASVNAPDASTGVVTGTLSATDADGDSLTFTANPTTPKGAVTISGATFVYTPTASARQQAASESATAADKADSFTVTVSDGRGGSSTFAVNVTVAPAVSVPTTVNNLGTVALTGDPSSAAISGDGTRAVVVTTTFDGSSTVHVTMFDTGTGAQIGTTTTLAGAQSTVQFNSTSTRAVVTVTNNDGGIFGDGSVAVFDTATGAQLGSTIDLGPVYTVGSVITGGVATAGEPVLFTADGTRGLIVGTFGAVDESTGDENSTSSVHLINLTTGAEIYSTAVPGYGWATLSADGSMAAIATVPDSISDGSSGSIDYSAVATTVTFLNAVTGGTVRSVQVTGSATIALNTDGSRAVISAITGTTGPMATSYAGLTSTITVVNTSTGARVGNPIIGTGWLSLPPVVTPDGTHALVSRMAIDASNPSSIIEQTSVVFIDLSTGNQVGSPVVIAGVPEAYVNGLPTIGTTLVGNGTRAVVVTMNPVFDGSSFSYSSHVTLIDTATGAQVGQAVELVGIANANVSADGSHLVVTGFNPNADPLVAAHSASPAVAIDIATGAHSSITVPDHTGWVGSSADGSRAVALSSDGTNSAFTTFDTVTGAQVGSVVTVPGSPATISGLNTVPVTGNYVTLVTSVEADEDSVTNVAFINMSTGTQVGTTTVIHGLPDLSGDSGNLVMDSDGRHAVVLTYGPSGTQVTLLSLT